MESLAALLGVTGLFGLIGGVIWLFVTLIRRRDLRKPGILSGVGFLIFVFALILTPSTDSDSQVQLNNKEQSVNRRRIQTFSYSYSYSLLQPTSVLEFENTQDLLPKMDDDDGLRAY